MPDSLTSRPGAILVTGASRGIGRAVALRLARIAPVAVNYHAGIDGAEAVVRSIQAAGGQAATFQADMADVEEASGLVRRVESALGPLVAVINNAGITRDRLLVQMAEVDWDATWDTDLAGPRALCRAALRTMSDRGGGRIVNISSVVGATGNAGQSNYASAKSALLGLTRQLAVEGASGNVTVNAVTPGYVITDATSHLTADQQAVWMRRIPMGRYATADEMTELVAFLLSPAAGYITGQCIAFDGGLLAASGWGFGS